MSLGLKKEKLSKKCEYVQVNIQKIDLVYLVNPLIDNNDALKMDSLKKKRRKRLIIFILIIILSLFSIILFGNFCSEDICALSSISSSLSRKKLFSEHHISRHADNVSRSSSSLKYSHR